MKEQIYTIPINEAFERRDGCPVCALYARAKEKSLEFVTGAAMMEPSVRIETNRLGFCREHFGDMLSMQNRLSVALMLESHMDETGKSVFADTRGTLSKKNDPEKTLARLERLTASCYVCSQIDDIMGHFCSNIVHMWKTEEDFRRLFADQPGFCLPHLKLLLSAGGKLSKKELPEYAQAAIEAAGRMHSTLRSDLVSFTRSFDYRFAEEGKEENVKSSVENTVNYLTSMKK